MSFIQFVKPGLHIYVATDDNAKGGLTQYWERLTVIPCAPKDFKH